MPAISKIRFTNVVYENGGKRYNDDIFQFDGYNGAILLENGGGKTVFVQTALQAVLPHFNLEERKIRDTLSLEGSPCHIAIEWILNEKPRRYLVTAVTLFLTNNKLDSYRYIYEYAHNDSHTIDDIPFVQGSPDGQKRPSSKGEIADYYQGMQAKNMNAQLFNTIRAYHEYIEKTYKIIPSEWRSIGRINSAEGGVENYFENCATAGQLVDRLLIPVVEEALQENGTKDFANTFEEQRERFKKHRQLRESILESQQIEMKIKGYVEEFEDYYKKDKALTDKKKYAKAVYAFINEEEEQIKEQMNKAQEEGEEIQRLLEEVAQKEASYELAVLNEALKEEKEKEKEVANAYHQVVYQYNDVNRKYHSLRVAQYKQEMKALEESIHSYKDQLKQLEEALDLEEVKAQLDENSSKLKGYYINEEEKFTKEREKLSLYKERVMEAYTEERRKEKELQQIKMEKNALYNKKEGQVISIRKELKRIIETIPVLEPNDDIKKQQQTWNQRINQLEEKTVHYRTTIRALNDEQQSVDEAMKVWRSDYNHLTQEQVTLTNNIEGINKEHETLLNQLKTLNQNWYLYTSIYSKENALLSYLENKIERLSHEKENLLLEERITGRYQDDYGNHKLFTAEPLIEQWAIDWKTQFKALETGTQYIQRAAKELGREEKDFLTQYPYWTLAMIADDDEIERLREKVEKQQERLSYPVLMMGQKEALHIIKNESSEDSLVILPKHWHENVNQEAFNQWKEAINHKVERTIRERKAKETELETYKESLRTLKKFLLEYPYDSYREIENQLIDVKNKISTLEERIQHNEKRLITINQEKDRCNQEIDNSKDEISQLNQWVQEVQLYLIKEGEVNTLSSEMMKLQEEIRDYDRVINQSAKELRIKEDQIEELKEEIRNYDEHIHRLISEPLYNEVKNYEPIYSNLSQAGLKEERDYLQERFKERQGDFQSINKLIQKDEQKQKEIKRDLERVRKEWHAILDESIAFPLYGEEQLEKLFDKLGQLKPIKNEKENQFNDQKKISDSKETEYSIYQKEYYKKFDALIVFDGPLHQVKDQLKNERDQLVQQRIKNHEQMKKLNKEAKEIEEGIKELEIANGAYHFLGEEIRPVLLEQQFSSDFPYHRLRAIEYLQKELEAANTDFDIAKSKLEAHRNQLIRFCEEAIKDPKLREKTVSGVRQKEKYEEVIEWKKRMEKSIHHIIQVAEDDMREHNKDLEQFINHLLTYLRTITQELNMIPKKTRIKVEDQWKDIYVFNLPEWNEEDGKEEIRKYVDWMIQELEKKEFKHEDGTENMGSIRKEIEKWLSTKRILPVVLKNRPIKISCRKVTNDNKISGTLTSWESSNKWSGGEKWSKNMTLFLGILNYVAEKRQGILPSLKTNRTVIVDNPFGKASSDHVLDPVFYIAEKLGFQIIALTAHTEGSFIRHYFPVVYSCRLRESVNNRSLIIDKEKEIHYAFFKDNAPESFNRLEERKQLSLFE